MSRIYFRTQHEGQAELLGAERAYMGCLTTDLATSIVPRSADRTVLAALTPEVRPQWERRTYPDGRPIDPQYLLQHGLMFAYERVDMLLFGDRSTFQLDGMPLENFSLVLNTALALGSDALCLLARLHAQCEIHAYVEGPNRAWMADLIGQGLDSGLYRSGMGWDTVQELLRAGDKHPVVTSFSVTDGFPNEYVAGFQAPEDNEDAWYELSESEQWERGLAGLRGAPDAGTEIKPEMLRYRYGHKKSMFDVFGSY